MFEVRIKRADKILAIDPENMQVGDLFKIVGNDTVFKCTSVPIYDDEEDCLFVCSGIDLFHISMVDDIDA